METKVGLRRQNQAEQISNQTASDLRILRCNAARDNSAATATNGEPAAAVAMPVRTAGGEPEFKERRYNSGCPS